MKKYLLIALAALGFAACTENQEDINPSIGGELEESYIAINLMSADLDSRAATDGYGYEDGTDAERKINAAYFFFFDENGNPFIVTGNGSGATAPGLVNEVNHLQLTIGETTGKQDPNVSDIKEAVLILNTYKGVYPRKIVAVLNWKPQTGKAYSLADLHSELAGIVGIDNGFVMSNSVYMDGTGKVVDAVPLTDDNIKTTAEAAKAAPIDIYVERIAAKVTLTASKGTIFNTEKTPSLLIPAGTTSNVEVYVKLHGWELYNDYATSNLIKNIENWDVTTLGLTWNDIPYYRCYWAQSQNTTLSDKFAWSYVETVNGEDKVSYGIEVGGATYCGENTNQATMVEGKITTDPRTKVILKGQLMQKNGENYEPLELASWYGTEYAGNEALKIAVANSLKYTLYYKESETEYVSIKPADLQVVAGATVGAKAYEVGFQLTTDAANKEWFKYDSTNGYVKFGDNAVVGDNVAKANSYLKGVKPAILYTSGQTYYYVDIEHLGTAGAKYGVVRNHVYQIDIQSIKGYGSPVYNGNSNLENPEYPPIEGESSYVAARINILSWKVVKQGVDIVQ